jgi:hypothetical protein
MNCELKPISLGMCCLVCISTPLYLYLSPLLNLAEIKVHRILTIVQLEGTILLIFFVSFV